ncbi:O-antigen polymerase [Bacillus cereus]|uniref:O-antigen polymerase n=1 Tax=Bacillus cereus TaxID=1396 RepID=UPI00362DEB6F
MIVIEIALISVIILQQFFAYFILLRKFEDYFNPVLFTFLFIYFPFCLSYFKLSTFQTLDIHPYLYVIMLISSSIIVMFSILIYPTDTKVKYEFQDNYKLSLVVILNILYVLFYFYENTVISGHLLPLMNMGNSGDTHLQGVKYIREINTVLRVLLPLLNFYLYYKTGKKRYLLLSIVTSLVPLSRGSRSAVVNSILMILAFKFKKINIKKILFVGVVLVVVINFAMSLGDHRRAYTSNSYGYEVGITSESLNEGTVGQAISWYYGYYSLSFYNFNTSLIKWLNDEVFFFGQANLNGLISYFITDYPSQQDFNSRIVNVNGAANVPTALYYYLIDFGVLGIFFFDLLFYSTLFSVYKKSKNDSLYRLIYCYLLLHILNFVFYSSFYAVSLYPIMIFVYLFMKLQHKKEKCEDSYEK